MRLNGTELAGGVTSAVNLGEDGSLFLVLLQAGT